MGTGNVVRAMTITATEITFSFITDQNIQQTVRIDRHSGTMIEYVVPPAGAGSGGYVVKQCTVVQRLF
jgi:hypothetical protein